MYHIATLFKHVRTAGSREELDALWEDFKAQFTRARRFIERMESNWLVHKKKAGVFAKEFTLKSFSGFGVEYFITADVEEGSSFLYMPDYMRHKIPFKHMFLVSRIYEDFDVNDDADLTRTGPTQLQKTARISEASGPLPRASSHRLY
ncbi:hypothetical protein BGZ65_010751 [Modicella reniformis]|uniref:Uncharacterized protein n=1 Tax=Modicella reniformis TaxID=1440133 RepID=A0A9P6LRT4_9FUNG|nr:hypothetical protein BGZ65_010751 [Modicella reniformis]